MTEQQLQELVQATFFQDHPVKGPAVRPALTLSSDSGSGGTAAARIIARSLGVTCFDQPILDAVIKLALTDETLKKRLRKRMRGRLNAMAETLLYDQDEEQFPYFERMVRVFLNIVPAGGVIVSHGAHLFLPEEHVYRVRTIGSREQRLRRVAASDHTMLEPSIKQFRDDDLKRIEFIRSFCRKFPGVDDQYDLEINTDQLDEQEVADQVLAAHAAAKRAGASAARATAASGKDTAATTE